MNVKNRVMKGWRPTEDRAAQAIAARRLRREGKAHEMTARMWSAFPDAILEAGLNPEDFGWLAYGSQGMYEAPLRLVLEVHESLVVACTQAGADGTDEVAECALAKWMHESERCGCWDARRQVGWQECEWRGYGLEDVVLVVATHVSEVPEGVAPEEHTYGEQRVVLHRWYELVHGMAVDRAEYEAGMDSEAARMERMYMHG